MERKKKSGAPCMPDFDFGTTVSCLLQSVDSHGLWGGLIDGLPSTLGSERSRFDQLSLTPPKLFVARIEAGLHETFGTDCNG